MLEQAGEDVEAVARKQVAIDCAVCKGPVSLHDHLSFSLCASAYPAPQPISAEGSHSGQTQDRHCDSVFHLECLAKAFSAGASASDSDTPLSGPTLLPVAGQCPTCDSSSSSPIGSWTDVIRGVYRRRDRFEEEMKQAAKEQAVLERRESKAAEKEAEKAEKAKQKAEREKAKRQKLEEEALKDASVKRKGRTKQKDFLSDDSSNRSDSNGTQKRPPPRALPQAHETESEPEPEPEAMPLPEKRNAPALKTVRSMFPAVHKSAARIAKTPASKAAKRGMGTARNIIDLITPDTSLV